MQQIVSASPEWTIGPLTAFRPGTDGAAKPAGSGNLLAGRSSHHVCSAWPSLQGQPPGAAPATPGKPSLLLVTALQLMLEWREVLVPHALDGCL